jgi:hypothetical protein
MQYFKQQVGRSETAPMSKFEFQKMRASMLPQSLLASISYSFGQES